MSALTLRNQSWHLLIAATRWALIALLLNLLWEIAQLPLYQFAPGVGSTRLAYYVLHCTAGDAMIATTIFLITGWVLSASDWPSTRPWAAITIVTLLGVGYTAGSEWYNVYQAGNWAYASAMPLVFGIGLAPLAQWLVVPVATLLTVRSCDRIPMHETPGATCQ